MQQNVPDFTALLRSAERSAVHLEMRDSYMADPLFDMWREGCDEELPDAYRQWQELVRETVARGVTLRRARIVSEPVTDYIRWEHSLTVRHNIAAGEIVRWLPRRLASDLALPGNDLWLIDGERVLFHWFTGDGEWAGHEFNEDPGTVKMVVTSLDAVWDRAIPHEEFVV
ncbi:hypothetical protein SJX93_08485 [Streptomyces cyaneofuscatus]|uniref:DUF6879 family protein n=1 Tax=Streptomyces cyaneofuscatus TaxID=66883 RepID=UPI002D780ABD|nr:DUF6879 family protein [Streptomyces cyaneofuscatus]WRO09655.1 hypothetical protein SJX93_08485 [Streptomyces cyaneofuscatus]